MTTDTSTPSYTGCEPRGTCRHRTTGIMGEGADWRRGELRPRRWWLRPFRIFILLFRYLVRVVKCRTSKIINHGINYTVVYRYIIDSTVTGITVRYTVSHIVRVARRTPRPAAPRAGTQSMLCCLAVYWANAMPRLAHSDETVERLYLEELVLR